MNKRVLLVLGVLAILVASTALSGCLGGNQTTPTTPGTATPTTPATSTGGKNPLASVTTSGDTITITGTKTSMSDDQYSETFNLEEGTYIYTWTNKGGYEDWFTAALESPEGDSYGMVSLMDPSGSSYLVVEAEGYFAKPGPARLNVANGGTYTVTYTKPTTGENVPLTVTGGPGEQVAKAVSLNPGPVTISVKHHGFDSSEQGTTMVGLHKVDTGKSVRLDGPWIVSETGDATGEIEEAGLYVFSVSFRAHTNGEATISQ
ncbi:hypothetical protein [Methanocella arvoryzae]|uniref:Uncharacterized protein n=1 Tax=Methanocella arvoryzae (strain DSM 22066 / NBRC 105507 / MRE50) TaxID=351160 RepID=Q0W6J9_METAR|nr:hypothetical protein [Methanocella arvoryzae]CAJ35994.1 hypothetical protein RCIX588 [Methanocella arvoryzae MRE50]